MTTSPTMGRREFAARLGISVRTLARWRQLDVVPAPLRLPGHARWNREHAERVIRDLLAPERHLLGRHSRDRHSSDPAA